MTTIPQLSYLMTTLLTTTADQLACATGFVQRVSPLSGSHFARILVFSWWQDPAATCEARADMAGAIGCPVSAQAIDKRFTPRAAAFLRALLSQAVQATVKAKVRAEPVAVPVLQRFTAVEVCDSSVICLPSALAGEWAGCGHATEAQTSALKVTVRFDLCAGQLHGPLLTPARTHDRRAALELAQELDPLPVGGLHIGDLAFFSLEQFSAWEGQGCYWLSRLKGGVVVSGYNGESWERLDLPSWLGVHCSHPSQVVETPILLGATHHLPARLIAQRVSARTAKERRLDMEAQAKREGRVVSAQEWALADWTLLVTNCPAHQLSVEEALALEGARWQIELLFKRWKSLGQIDEWRTHKPWRIMCEVYAKLLIMVLQHWLVVMGSWHIPDRSLWRGVKVVQRRGQALASAWGRGRREWLAQLAETVRAVGRCRIDKRKNQPSTYQLLLAASPPPLLLSPQVLPLVS